MRLTEDWRRESTDEGRTQQIRESHNTPRPLRRTRANSDKPQTHSVRPTSTRTRGAPFSLRRSERLVLTQASDYLAAGGKNKPVEKKQ